MNIKEASDLVTLALEFSLAGFIATNTSIKPEIGLGGVSGSIIKEKSRVMRNHFLKLTQGTSLDVIGVGGVDSYIDLLDFFKNGGRAMQLYTSFIYEGPSVLNKIYSDLESDMKKAKTHSLKEFINTLVV